MLDIDIYRDSMTAYVLIAPDYHCLMSC